MNKPLKLELLNRDYRDGSYTEIYYSNEYFIWGYNTIGEIDFDTDTELNLWDFVKISGWNGSSYTEIDHFVIKEKQKNGKIWTYRAVQLPAVILDPNYFQVKSSYIRYHYDSNPSWTWEDVIRDVLSKGFINSISNYPLGTTDNETPSDSNLGFHLDQDMEIGSVSHSSFIENMHRMKGDGKSVLYYFKQKTLYMVAFPTSPSGFDDLKSDSNYLLDGTPLLTWENEGIKGNWGYFQLSDSIHDPSLDSNDFQRVLTVVSDGEIKEYKLDNYYTWKDFLDNEPAKSFFNRGKTLDNFAGSSDDEAYISNNTDYSSSQFVQYEFYLNIFPGYETRFFFGKKSGTSYTSSGTKIEILDTDSDCLTVNYRHLDKSTLVATEAWQTVSWATNHYEVVNNESNDVRYEVKIVPQSILLVPKRVHVRISYYLSNDTL